MPILAIGIISILVGYLIGIILKGGSAGESTGILSQIGWAETAALLIGTFLSVALAVVLQIIIHEGGHLLAGLMTGYGFVSFRIFNVTLVRKDGSYRWKSYAVGGTGGQCLMSPPEKPLEEIDTRWYNAGGVLANVIVSTIALLVFLFTNLPVYLNGFLLMFFIGGYAFALSNSIPLKMGGVCNDGYNMLFLEKNPKDKKILCDMLRMNELLQNGTQLKDMPDELFPVEGDCDWGDALQANMQIVLAGRLMNQHSFEKARLLLLEALENKEKMVGLFVMEAMTEMVFLCLINGQKEEARKYYTKKVQKYVRQFAHTQSGKQCVLFADALLLEDDRKKALSILDSVRARKDRYLAQGEVTMDIELMEWMMINKNEIQN